jgi:hypothetical protein
LRFKIDQNLPAEYAALLREAGFEADTVDDEGLSGASVPQGECGTKGAASRPLRRKAVWTSGSRRMRNGIGYAGR